MKGRPDFFPGRKPERRASSAFSTVCCKHKEHCRDFPLKCPYCGHNQLYRKRVYGRQVA